MIPQDIVFFRPETRDEALQAWRAASRPRYFSGGTEIVTLAREGRESSTDLIDLKAIPELREMSSGKEKNPHTGAFSFGAALTLNAIIDSGLFPLLRHCSAGVADRTTRNSITLGGNICGMLPYREAVLPFLLLDGEIEVAGPAEPVESAAFPTSAAPAESAAFTTSAAPVEPDVPAVLRRVPVRSLFNKRLNLRNGEFAVRFTVNADAVLGIQAGEAAPGGPAPVGSGSTGSTGTGSTDGVGRLYGPVEASGSGPRGGWFYHRRTRESRIDYPVSTVAMVLFDGELRLAISGTWGYPYRAVEAEAVFREAMHGETARSALNEPRKLEDLAAGMVDAVQLPVKDDFRAGREYRREVTVLAIAAGLQVLTGHASTVRSV